MKAITICEPYASAIIRGPKRVENRPNPWRFRGRLLVHAGKSKKYMGTMTKRQLDQWNPDLSGFRLEFGHILGSIEVFGCVHYELDGNYKTNDPWAFGPWLLRLRDPIAFTKPIPFRGQLGLFDVPDDLIAHEIERIESAITQK